MNALAVLQHALAASVRVEAEGGDLILEATAGDVPLDLIAEARAAKPELMALLRTALAPPKWDASTWCAFFDERAGIAQFDGKVPRNIAEARAYQWCIVEWLNKHPVASPPDRCAACGKEDAPGAAIVPFGTGPHVWLHPECWREWRRARIAAAEAELTGIGLGVRGLR